MQKAHANLQKVIKESQEEFMRSLEIAKVAALDEIEGMSGETKKITGHMQNIHKDIDTNFDQIVNMFDKKECRAVLDNYSNQLEQFQEVMEQVRENEVELKRFHSDGLEAAVEEAIRKEAVLNEISMEDLDTTDLPQCSKTDSVYVSFENKEAFLNAQQ